MHQYARVSFILVELLPFLPSLCLDLFKIKLCTEYISLILESLAETGGVRPQCNAPFS